MHPRLLTLVVAALAIPSLAVAAGTSPDRESTGYGGAGGYALPPDANAGRGYGGAGGYGMPTDANGAPGYAGSGGYGMPTDANGAPGYAGSGGYGPSSPDGIPTEPGGGPGNDGSGYGQPPPDRTPPEYGGYPGDGGAPGYGPDGRPEGGPTLSDAQIVGILHVVNQGEVLAGQQAQRKAEDPMVRDFANRLVAEHASLDQQLLALAAQLGVSPEPSQVTDKLEAVKGHVLAKLERFSGPAYDVAYIDTQLAGHGGLVALLDFLGTKAVTPALRDAIRAARPLVLSQLEQATAVREQLQDL